MKSTRWLRWALGAVLLAGLLPTGAHAAPAKPIVYPVKITIKVKTVPELPPDSPWRGVEGVEGVPVVALYGRITSPKRACVRKRPIIAIEQSIWTVRHEDRHTGVVSDGAGNWEGEAVPDFFTERVRNGEEQIWVKVARRQISKGRFCAEAKSTRLKV